MRRGPLFPTVLLLIAAFPGPVRAGSGLMLEPVATVGPDVIAYFDESVIDGTATTQLAPPTELDVSVGAVGELLLSWQDNSAGEAGYRIERSLDPGTNFVEIGTTAADTTTYADAALIAAIRYYYRVRAFSASAGNSGYSNTASAVADSPGQIADLRVFPNGPTVDLSWQPSCSPQAVDYAIYEGEIGQWYSHGLRQCSTHGATSFEAFPPDMGSRYFLVVPLGTMYEGSYGTNSDGTERPQPNASCRQYRVPDYCP